MWLKLATEGVAMGLALLTTWLTSRGAKVTPKEIADKAQKYIDLNMKDLDSEEDKDDDSWSSDGG